jgi:hypothetical protein
LAHLSITGLFKLKPKLLPRSWHNIVNSSGTAPYPTLAPVLAVVIVEERELVNYCRKNLVLHSIEDCWKACLLGGAARKLLISNPAFYGGKWFISLGSGGGKIATGIPMKKASHQGKEYFTPEPMKEFYWMPILDWDDWKCVTFNFKSPLGVKVSTLKWLSGSPSLTIWPDTPTVGAPSLLDTCIFHAFFDMPKTALRRVAKDLGCVYTMDDDAVDLVVIIARFKFPLLSNEAIIAILRHRAVADDEALELLIGAGEVATDNLDKDDKEEVEQGKEVISARKKVERKILEFAKKAAEPLPPAIGAASGSGGPPAAAAAPAKKPRKYPPKVQLGAVTRDEINDMLPFGCTVRADTHDQSWILNCYGHRKSRAWTEHTVEGAAMYLITYAWSDAIRLGYEIECPIEGVMPL